MKQNGTTSPYTGKRRKIAEALANPDFTGTITSLIESVGVPRTTFYRWLDEPEYLEYINSLVDKYTDSELAAVWKSLISECKGGNVQAIKLYFELKGKYTTKIQADIKTSDKLSDVFAQIGGEGLDDS